MLVVVESRVRLYRVHRNRRERVRGEGGKVGRGREREGWREGWRRTAGSGAERGEREERRVQLRVGRRSVCQSFVWTSRLTRLIVCSRSGIGLVYTRELRVLAASESAPLDLESCVDERENARLCRSVSRFPTVAA